MGTKMTHKNIPHHRHISLGMANDTLVDMIVKQAVHTVTMEEEQRQQFEDKVEATIIKRCSAYHIKPDSYISYYKSLVE